MSTAIYPQGMSSYNNRLPQGGYKSWKGTGVLSNPVGITASNIRPLTNNDIGNVFPTGFGLARPIKHFRKGRVIPVQPILVVDPENPFQYIEVNQINYNLNRFTKSSIGASLGGGAGGRGPLTQTIDMPGSVDMKQNVANETNNMSQLNKDCKTCEGVGIISSYYPNNTYLTENPEPNTTNPLLCCNEEKKALRRVIPANTNLPKKYYTTLQQYRENRCKTFQQRAFNFQSGPIDPLLEALSNSTNPFITDAAIKAAKPGSALALLNTYVANCQPNAELEETSEYNLILVMVQIMKNQGILTPAEAAAFYNLGINTFKTFLKYIASLPKNLQPLAGAIYNDFIANPFSGMPITGPSNPAGCKLVVYKPNNPQFAQQGGVSSSTRTFKLNVTTIQKNLAGYNRDQKIGAELNIGNKLTYGQVPAVPFLYKNKSTPCQAQTQIHFQNHKSCTNSDPTGNPSQPAGPSNSTF